MKCERLVNLNSAWVTAADSANYDSDNTAWSNKAHDRNHWHWTTAVNYWSVNEDLKIGHLSCELVKNISSRSWMCNAWFSTNIADLEAWHPLVAGTKALQNN